MYKLLLSLILILSSFIVANSQRTNISIFTGSGAPLVCFSGTIYIDNVTGNLYTYKVLTGCKLAGNVNSITGEGAEGAVTFWDSTTNISSSPNFTFDLGTRTLNIGRDVIAGNDIIATRQLIGQFGTITPLSDVSSLYLRRFSSTQISPILLFQTEANVQLTYFDKNGVFNGNVIGNLTGIANGNELPLTFSSPLSRSVNTISCPTCALTTTTTLSSLASIGTITTGVWNGTIINSTYGGTGINNVGRTLTLNTNSGTFSFGAASKTITFNNTLGFSGTDSTTHTFPSTSSNVARIDAAQIFAGNQQFNGNIQFSGTTSLFPMWRRTTTTIDARLADDSGYANISAGHLLLNPVTAQAFAAAFPSIQLGAQSTFSGNTSTSVGTAFSISHNAYFDGTNWRYIISDLASNYFQLSGTHNWRYAATGTAGNVITWIPSWTINNTGQLVTADDNARDIGANGATRPRTGYFGTSIIVPLVNSTTYQTSGVTIYSSGTPSIAGNATLNTGSKDSAGKITSTGTGASTAVITFSTAFTRAPACFVSNETTSNLVRPISTTTTLTISATVVTGDSLSYICIGY